MRVCYNFNHVQLQVLEFSHSRHKAWILHVGGFVLRFYFVDHFDCNNFFGRILHERICAIFCTMTCKVRTFIITWNWQCNAVNCTYQSVVRFTIPITNQNPKYSLCSIRIPGESNRASPMEQCNNYVYDRNKSSSTQFHLPLHVDYLT